MSLDKAGSPPSMRVTHKMLILFSIVVNRRDGQRYAMKCLKKGKIRREGKMHHVMNERRVLEMITKSTNEKEGECPFFVKMEWAY